MSAPPPAVVVDRYEAARAWATGTAQGAGRPPGLALVLRRGLPAWLAAWETWLPAQAGADEPLDVGTTSPTRPCAHDHALAVVLATMVEHCRRDRREREEQ